MQNKQAEFYDDGENSASQPESIPTLVGYLWQRFYKPSSETLTDVAALVLELPEPYKMMGLKILADSFTTLISLHYLDVIATFKNNAEQEGIDKQEQKETIDEVVSEWLQKMVELSSNTLIQSPEDLIKLIKITVGTYGLSRPGSAEHAQEISYSLPSMYCEPLERAGLLRKE